MRRELIVLLAFILPQAPPIDPAIGAEHNEAWHEDRIVAAWEAAGIDVETQVHTDTGAYADIVTDKTAWELDWAYKWAEGVGQGAYYGEELDRECGLLLLVADGDDRFVTRARIACKHAKVQLFLIPIKGDVPLPVVKQSLTTEPTPANTITMHTAPFDCPPCEAFKADCLPTLRDKGWHVEIVTGGAYSYPTFAYNGRRWTGYTSARGFYGRLKAVMK